MKKAGSTMSCGACNHSIDSNLSVDCLQTVIDSQNVHRIDCFYYYFLQSGQRAFVTNHNTGETLIKCSNRGKRMEIVNERMKSAYHR